MSIRNITDLLTSKVLPALGDSKILKASDAGKFFLADFETFEIREVECDEYSPILFRRKGGNRFEPSFSPTHQVVRTEGAASEAIRHYLGERISESEQEVEKHTRLVERYTEILNRL